MAKNKTEATTVNVDDFIAAVPDARKRADSYKLIEMMEGVTGSKATMWGPSIIGFGSYHYVYDSGHSGDAPLAGFSPRSAAISVYVATDFPERDELVAKLGKVKVAKACLYIKKLDDVDLDVLKTMVERSAALIKKLYPDNK